MVKQGYKQTEIGVIPEDWDVVKLGQFCFITKLAGFEYSKYFNSYKDGGEIIVVRGTNITNNKLDLSDVKYIPKRTSDFLHRSKLSKGDLVFAYVGTIGPIYLINEDDRFHLGPNTAKIRIENKNVCKSYLYNYFLSENIKKEIDDRISVGAQPSLSMSKIRDFSIILPPLAEQEAIATALSDADAWIASLEQLIAKKHLIKQGAMQELLTPKEDWEVKKLGEVAEIIIGLTYSPNDVSEYGTLVLRSSNIQNNKLAFNNNVFVNMKLPERVIVKENDLLVCVRNGSKQLIGKCALIDKKTAGQAFGAFMSIIRCDFGEYLYHYFQTNHIQNQIDENLGATINQLTNAVLKSFEIYIPKSLSEQERIATILSDMDAELEALVKQSGKAQQIKQGMMQELLTGRVRLV